MSMIGTLRDNFMLYAELETSKVRGKDVNARGGERGVGHKRGEWHDCLRSIQYRITEPRNSFQRLRFLTSCYVSILDSV